MNKMIKLEVKETRDNRIRIKGNNNIVNTCNFENVNDVIYGIISKIEAGKQIHGQRM